MNIPGKIKRWSAALKNIPAGAQGSFYDYMVLAAGLILFSAAWSPIYNAARPVDNTFRPGDTLAKLMIASAAAQAAGSLLKAGGLQVRLRASNPGYSTFSILRNWKIDAVLLMHLLLFFSMFFLALAASCFEPFMNSIPHGAFVAWMLFLCSFIPVAFVMVSLLVPFGRNKTESDTGIKYREWIGNVLLVFSAVVIQAWFQGVLLTLMGRSRVISGETSMEAAIGQLAVLFPLFLLVYLPPRVMFLVEDYSMKRTWMRVILINFVLALRYFFFAGPGPSGGF